MGCVATFFGALPGSGKSFSEVEFLVHWWIPYFDGVHYSNLPLFVDKIAAYCAKKYAKRGVTLQSVLDRIHVIPEETFQKWMEKDEEGPWSYFQGVDISGGRIFLDEIHYIAGSKDHPKWKEKWQRWLGMIRHEKAEIVFASQSEGKVAKYIRDHCGQRITLTNEEDLIDIWTGIEKRYLYEIRAKITGVWDPYVTRRTQSQNHGKWITIKQSGFRLGPPIYGLYNSFSKPYEKKTEEETSDDLETVEKKKPKGERLYLRLSWPSLLWVVALQSAYPVGKRLLLGGALCWLLFFGGSRYLFERLHSRFSFAQPKKNPVDGAELVAVPEASSEVQQLKALIIAQEVALKKFRDQEERQKSIVALGTDFVVLRGGYRYGLGQVITHGPLKGRKVTSITYQFRLVVLDSQEAIWLGH